MSQETTHCEVCAADSHASALVKGMTEEKEAYFCMRCFHALMHGMPVAQLRERWQEYQASCKH